MRISFDDGSFLSIHPSDTDPKQLTLVVCGKKSKYTTTMSSSELTYKQAGDLAEFLLEWMESFPKED